MQFVINTQKDQELVDITDKVKKIVSESGIKEGLCNVYTVHSTAAIVINENWDSSVCKDILSTMEKIAPKDAGYEHDKMDGNGHSHIKSAILGPSRTIPVSKGELQLGRWQGISFGEFDGPKRRTVIVEVIGK